MEKQQLIGTLKKIDTCSKVDTDSKKIHTVTVKLELIDGQGVEYLRDIANNLNKPIRVDFDAVQLKANI